MKTLLSLVLTIAFSFQTNAQGILPYSPGLVFETLDCINCQPSSNEYQTGIKTGIGFGLVKELTPRVDLTTNLSYQHWTYQVNVYHNYNYYYPADISQETNHLINLSLGQRFHFIKFERSSFFTGTNLNFQAYSNELRRSFGLSIEPSLGWKKDLGKKSEFFMSLGYDQLLTSYDQQFKHHPGRLGINFGFNLLLKKKVKDIPLGE